MTTRARSTTLTRLIVVAAFIVNLLVAPAVLTSPAGAAPAATVVSIDSADSGRTFDGVGALSASSSRLLYDYPEPERSRLLDEMFKPDYGMSLQILKVEIGGDTNSTVISEPSHERTRGDLNCQRGIEWWLMKQAKKRNPNIKLYGLLWGAPGWLSGGLWGSDHVDYVMSWLGCAKANGLRIDYIGGANEIYTPPPTASFFEELHNAVAATYPHTKVVATDEHVPPNYFAAATAMAKDPDYASAVDVLGEHDLCVWKTLYQQCHANTDAIDLGKPLWNSEQDSQSAGAGVAPMARAMTRDYIDARATANIIWPLDGAFYGNTAVGAAGPLLTQWPWSGYFVSSASVWVEAQVAQFTEPGWRYVDHASGYLPRGGSYVTLRNPRSGDYTIIVETADATGPEKVRFNISGRLSSKPLDQWSTVLDSQNPSDWFRKLANKNVRNHSVTATFQPDRMYTLSTTRGQRRVQVTPPRGSVDKQLPLPYREDFQHVPSTKMAKYFQDQQGAFEAAPCLYGRRGTCYRQVITQQPIQWHANGGTHPKTVVGDPTWPGDYTVSTDAMLEQPGGVEVIGRVDNQDAKSTSGYHLQYSDTGSWQLYDEDLSGADTVLASGTGPVFGTRTWHRLALTFAGTTIRASIDGDPLATVSSDTHNEGQVGLAVSGYQNAEFDNLTVVPTGVLPRYVPSRTITASASSQNSTVFGERKFLASYALDGELERAWKTQVTPTVAPLPQSITLDLHRARKLYGVAYRPEIGKAGIPDTITQFTVAVSSNGRTFRTVSAGTWPATPATKTASWNTPVNARYVRLTALNSEGGMSAAASEIRVLASRPPAGA